MTKEEAKLKLRKDGYQVVDDNSVVTVIISSETSLKNIVKDVKTKLASWGYEASFAVKQHKGELSADSADEEKDEVDYIDEESEEMLDEVEATGEETVAEEKATKKAPAAKASKKENTKDSNSDDEGFLDDDDEDSLSDIKIDEDDMDMLLNEESIQFSLEDFGMNF